MKSNLIFEGQEMTFSTENNFINELYMSELAELEELHLFRFYCYKRPSHDQGRRYNKITLTMTFQGSDDLEWTNQYQK